MSLSYLQTKKRRNKIGAKLVEVVKNKKVNTHQIVNWNCLEYPKLPTRRNRCR